MTLKRSLGLLISLSFQICVINNQIILNNSMPSDFLAAYVLARLLFSYLPLFFFFLALS